jgi:outer membrane cobalamin receptor|tara:strand:- start:213 stop:821 length:609 start_codon:yes stop_codon:yes gene_type:complete
MSDDNKTIKLSDKDKKYWSNRIDSEVSEKRQELERAIELKADKQIKKQYKKFVSSLKLASKLTAFKKASKEYDDFVKLKEIKEEELKNKRKKLARDVEEVYNRQAKIHGWEQSNLAYNCDYDDFEHFLNRMCRDALNVELKKSTKEGALLNKMDEQKQKMFDAIHHPKLLFKQIEFERAMKNGFLNMGIVYNTLQISNKGGE